MQREKINYDIVIVGAGPAGLCAALKLRRLCKNKSIIVIEKSARVGENILSGAILDPSTLHNILSDDEINNLPIESEIKKDPFYFLTKSAAIKIPFMPPYLRNKGLPLISLGNVCKYLADICEREAIDIVIGFSAKEIILEGNEAKGVVVAEKGLTHENKTQSNYYAGCEIRANIVILAEGAQGYLTRKVCHCEPRQGRDNLHKTSEQWGLLSAEGGPASGGRQIPRNDTLNPQSMVLIFKELIEVKDGDVKFNNCAYHFFGYPHDPMTYGGAFLYSMKDGLVAIGVATGLDYKDPKKDLYKTLVDFKNHPFIKKLLGKDYQVRRYGAKLVPEGGYYSIPRSGLPSGLFIIGDSAGWVNAVRIKGIHLAIESASVVAHTISRYFKNEVGRENLSEYYNDTIFSGPAGLELYRVRNIHQTFHFGAPIGAAATGINWITGGLLPPGKIKSKGDSNRLKPLKSFLSPPKFTLAEAGAEDKLQQESRNFLKDWIPAFASLASSARRARMTSEEIPEPLDKSESVYLSGTIHREDQPCHCKLDEDKLCLDCKIEYGQPCLRFCPGGVYEKDPNIEDKIFVNFSNCVHCKTCEIKCPKDNLTWTPPEGGEGPHYRRM